MLYIGSTATKFRSPKDVDILSTTAEFEKFKSLYNIKDEKFHIVHYSFRLNNKWFEVEICDEGTSGFDYQTIMNSFDKIKLEEIPCSTNEIMLSIKKSHIHYPVKFYKNILDYNALLIKCNNTDIYKNITAKRNIETKERLGDLKTPKLSKSSKKFFSQSHKFFKSYFIHDNIHHVMAHLDKPLYEYMQPDPNAAFCSKAMWDAFPEDWKDKCVLEEAYVIALERKLIPNVFGGEKYVSPQDAIQWSLMRIATTLCSGWFRQWACDNWVRIVSKVDSNYFDKFLSAIDDGKIQMSSGVNYVEND